MLVPENSIISLLHSCPSQTSLTYFAVNSEACY